MMSCLFDAYCVSLFIALEASTHFVRSQHNSQLKWTQSSMQKAFKGVSNPSPVTETIWCQEFRRQDWAAKTLPRVMTRHVPKVRFIYSVSVTCTDWNLIIGSLFRTQGKFRGLLHTISYANTCSSFRAIKIRAKYNGHDRLSQFLSKLCRTVFREISRDPHRLSIPNIYRPRLEKSRSPTVSLRTVLISGICHRTF